MDTEIDWQRELDASFGSRDDRPTQEYVAVGRRAVRRRRITAAVAGLGAAVVAAGVAWGLAPAGRPSSDGPVATDSRATSAVADPTGWRDGELPVRVEDGAAVVPEDAVVHERVDNLFPGKGTDSSAFDLTWRGQRWWVSIEWDDAGSSSGSGTSPDEGLYDSFHDFVIAESQGGGMGGGPVTEDDRWLGGLVRWTGGEVTARRGVEVLREVADPMPAADDSIGLVLSKNGVTTWMVVSLTPGGSSASWTEESGSGWATFEEWLVEQAAMAEGVGTESPVRLDGGTVVGAQPGVTVIEQLADPDLRAYGTSAKGATSAVALIDWNDRRWFVLVIDDSVTPVALDKAGGATTLEEFVAFMADRVDEGGMR